MCKFQTSPLHVRCYRKNKPLDLASLTRFRKIHCPSEKRNNSCNIQPVMQTRKPCHLLSVTKMIEKLFKFYLFSVKKTKSTWHEAEKTILKFPSIKKKLPSTVAKKSDQILKKTWEVIFIIQTDLKFLFECFEKQTKTG